MVVLEFSYSVQDIVRAWQRHFRKRTKVHIDLVAIPLLAGFGLYRGYASGVGADAYVPLGAASPLALGLCFCWYILPRWHYRRNERLQKPISMAFSEGGIQYREANVEATIRWELFRRTVADGYSYLLYQSKDDYTLVPARTLANPEQRGGV